MPRPLTPDQSVAEARARGNTLDYYLAELQELDARLKVDIGELDRAKGRANIIGKAIGGVAKRVEAYKRGKIIPTHENLPFFIPAGVVATPPAGN